MSSSMASATTATATMMNNNNNNNNNDINNNNDNNMPSHYDEQGKAVMISSREEFENAIWKKLAAEQKKPNEDAFDFSKLVHFIQMAFGEVKVIQAVLESIVAQGPVTSIDITTLNSIKGQQDQISSSILLADKKAFSRGLREESKRLEQILKENHCNFSNQIFPLLEAGWRVRQDLTGWKVDTCVEQLTIPFILDSVLIEPVNVASVDNSEDTILHLNTISITGPPSISKIDEQLLAKQLSLISRDLFTLIRAAALQDERNILVLSTGPLSYKLISIDDTIEHVISLDLPRSDYKKFEGDDGNLSRILVKGYLQGLRKKDLINLLF